MRAIGLALIAGLTFTSGAQAQDKYKTTPYMKTGVANCVLPGTSAEFFLDGRGGAKLVKASSNYDGFRQAARIKNWKAMTLTMEGRRMLVIDNGKNSRIMTELPAGKGMAFLFDGGVSDIVCQVMVSDS
jgi:hypothetical protein